VGAGEDVRPVETEPGAYPDFYAAVDAALRDAGPPPVSAAEGVAVLDVIEAAMESSRSGQVIQVG
jgi:predicted dehydrogenase